eukprot:SAG11_NODE_5013_length_1691_cov_1.589824_2_plen_149_part_00
MLEQFQLLSPKLAHHSCRLRSLSERRKSCLHHSVNALWIWNLFRMYIALRYFGERARAVAGRRGARSPHFLLLDIVLVANLVLLGHVSVLHRRSVPVTKQTSGTVLRWHLAHRSRVSKRTSSESLAQNMYNKQISNSSNWLRSKWYSF